MFRQGPKRRRSPGGWTLPEMLVALSVTGLVAVSMLTLSELVGNASRGERDQGTALQEARVYLDRVESDVSSCFVNSQFPGFIIVSNFGSNPDTILIWRPTTAQPQNPTGLPVVSELVLYRADPTTGQKLIQVRSPGNNATAPDYTDTNGWKTLSNTMVTDSGAQVVTLSTRLRTGGGTGAPGGCLRFDAYSYPTDAEIAAYQTGTKTWSQLLWPLDQYGTTSGLRRHTVNLEIQLMVDTGAGQTEVFPFFGCGVREYSIQP